MLPARILVVVERMGKSEWWESIQAVAGSHFANHPRLAGLVFKRIVLPTIV
jgi:hypothetical protein